MGNKHFDIRLDLHLQGIDGRIDPKYLLQILESLETSLYASDRKDIELAAKELDISNVVRDACLERLRNQRHHRMIIVDAKPGSLELVGLVAGVSFFILEKTIGEAFSDAVKESKLHDKLKDFFRRQIDGKALFIAEYIRRTFSSKKRDVTVKALPSSDEKPNTIKVDVPGEDGKRLSERIKSLGEELDKD